jgi:hypothetical protein
MLWSQFLNGHVRFCFQVRPAVDASPSESDTVLCSDLYVSRAADRDLSTEMLFLFLLWHFLPQICFYRIHNIAQFFKTIMTHPPLQFSKRNLIKFQQFIPRSLIQLNLSIFFKIIHNQEYIEMWMKTIEICRMLLSCTHILNMFETLKYHSTSILTI